MTVIASASIVLALASAPAQAADPVVAAAGDIACDPADPQFNGGSGTASRCRQTYTSDPLVSADLSAVLPLGDLQYVDGALDKFQASYDASWGRVKSISRPAIGNHDQGAGYYDYFNGAAVTGPAGPTGSGYYSFDLGSWHLVALNTNCWALGGCGAGSAQQKWLEEDLARNSSSCTLAYWHEAFFSSSRPGWAAAAFLDDLYAAGADLALSGHVHNYERFAPQTPGGVYDPAYGLRHFVVGTGGHSLSPFGPAVASNSEVRLDSSFGVLALTLRPTGYEWRFVSEGGAVQDSGSGACHDPPPTPPVSRAPHASPAPKRPSVSGDKCTVIGTPGSDVLTGTRRRDVICGLGGNDALLGGAGDDVLAGGDGSDRMLGSAGDDRIHGGAGGDRLRGGQGDDRIYGGRGNDRLLGNSGRDRLDGGPGRDRASIGTGDRFRRVERLARTG